MLFSGEVVQCIVVSQFLNDEDYIDPYKPEFQASFFICKVTNKLDKICLLQRMEASPIFIYCEKPFSR